LRDENEGFCPGASLISAKISSTEIVGYRFDRYVYGEHVGQPAIRPKLAATFQSVLELAAGGFHGAETNRGIEGGHLVIVEEVAVVLEVMDPPLGEGVARSNKRPAAPKNDEG